MIENNKACIIKMDKVIESCKRELSKIRTGRANPNILDNIRVIVYGENQPIHSIARISVPEARMLVIKPFDRSHVTSINKAVSSASLDLQIIAEAEVVRLVFPIITEENRKKLVRKVKEITENFKVEIRNIRRDTIQILKNQNLSEDQIKIEEKKIQETTDKYILKLNEIEKTKEKELMTI